MKITLFLSVLIPAALLLILPLPASARTGYYRITDPGGRRQRHLVREPDLPISETVTAPGFWRPRHRCGYRWVEASRDDAGRWHGGYWEPLNIDRLTERVTVPGYWGPPSRYGYIRITRQDRPGDYLAGRWELMNSYRIREEPLEWVPGYWNRRRWVPGYWRVPRKEGYVWAHGYFRENGRWQQARWVPAPDRD